MSSTVMLNFLNIYRKSYFCNFKVSLIGIQVIGEKQHTDLGDVSHHSSICDDLAFEMYVDKQIAETIRMLENRKITAVRGNVFLKID